MLGADHCGRFCRVVSTVLAAIGCAGQLAWSGTVGWAAAFTSMTSVHLLIGLGEGLISALVLAKVERAAGFDLSAGAEWRG